MSGRFGDALLRFLRSLIFGGFLGGGVAAWIGPAFFTQVGFDGIVAAGIVVGATLHRAIGAVWTYALGPLAEYGKTEVQMWKLRVYLGRGWITEGEFVELADRIVRADIMGEEITRPRLPEP